MVVPASSANVRSAAVSNGELNLIPLLVASKQRPDYNKRVSIDSTSYLPATLELVFYLGFPQGRDCCWCIASLGLPRLRRPTTPVTCGRKGFWLYQTAIACQTVGCSLSFSTIVVTCPYSVQPSSLLWVSWAYFYLPVHPLAGWPFLTSQYFASRMVEVWCLLEYSN